MMFVGIDPDLHCTSVAYWMHGKPVQAYVIYTPRVKGRIEQAAVLDMVWAIKEHFEELPSGIIWAVEAQTLHVTGLKQHKRPQDIVTLGNVAGAILSHIASFESDRTCLMFPTAKEWKGQIPKAVMQARFYTDLKWGYEMVGKGYARPVRPPSEFSNIGKTDWKHVGDALMLAKWASLNWNSK